MLQRLIGSYKFNGLRAADRVLAELLHVVAPELPSNTVITWVPTSPKHIRVRGYDHMKRLAKAFGKVCHLPVQQLLERKTFHVQHKSSRADRFAQIKGAFVAVTPLDPFRTYVLLDDIYTTGATIDEAIYTMKQAGAVNITIGVIAQQPLD